jgi:hypothetical protein
MAFFSADSASRSMKIPPSSGSDEIEAVLQRRCLRFVAGIDVFLFELRRWAGQAGPRING